MPGIREIIIVVSIILRVSDGIGSEAIFLHSTVGRALARRVGKRTTTPVCAVKLVNASEYGARPQKPQPISRAVEEPTLKYPRSVAFECYR